MLRALHDLGFDWEAFEYFAFILDDGERRDAGGRASTCRSCTASAARPTSPSTRSTTSPATAAPGRCASATARSTSSSTTCGGCCSTRSPSTSATAARSPSRSGTGSRAWSTPRSSAFPEPDQGIWEMRGEPKHFVASKVMCWVAVDRGLRLARERDGDAERIERWEAAAEKMHAEILRQGTRRPRRLHPALRHRGARRVAAAHPDHGLPARRRRAGAATVLAIADELTKDDLVLRYRVETTDDGLSGEEGTFTICSFWLVSALAIIGEVERAREAVPEAAVVRRPTAPVRGGDRHHHRPAPRQLPPGVHPPRARSTRRTD